MVVYSAEAALGVSKFLLLFLFFFFFSFSLNLDFPIEIDLIPTSKSLLVTRLRRTAVS